MANPWIVIYIFVILLRHVFQWETRQVTTTMTPTVCTLKTTSGECCSIPFTYRGVTYKSCTNVKHHRLWCSLDSQYKGNWGNCMSTITTMPPIVCSQRTIYGQCCSIPFIYKNVTYSSCTYVDHQRPWCSLDSHYKDRWEYCPYDFNVWLTIPEKEFTLDLLNSTSTQYQQTKVEIMNKFNNHFNRTYGYLGAELLRFGARTRRSQQPYLVEPMVDIRVFCTSCSVKNNMITEIESRVREIQMFNNTFLEIVDTENCTCPPVLVNLNLTKDLQDIIQNVLPGKRWIPFRATVNRLICSLSATSGYWNIFREYDPPEHKTKFIATNLSTSKPFVNEKRNLEKDVFFYVSYILKSFPKGKIIGYDYGYFAVKRDPPIASIMGLLKATKGDGNIILNGSLLHNPEQTKQLNFTWLCRRIYEILPTPYHIADLPKVRTNFSRGCFGYGPGILSVTTNILVVDVDKMEEGQTYVFELIITSGQETFNASHQLTIHPDIKFLISCSYNCGPKAVDPSQRTVVKSSCTGSLCKNITRYEWHLFELHSAEVNRFWKDVTDLDKRINTPNDNPVLELVGKIAKDEYSLKMNTSYKINGSIEVNGKKKYSSLNEIRFETMSPLSIPNDTCKVTPTEGVALETNFTVDCTGWQYQYANLTYSFRYIAALTGLVILESKTPNHRISTSLPSTGNRFEDYNLTIVFVIEDTNGASHSDKLIVKVRPYIKTSNVTDAIDDLLEKGDVRGAATTAISYLLGSSDNQKKDTILSSMAAVNITKISEATQLTTIAVLATQDRDGIPLETMENTASVLNNTIIFLLKNAVNNRDVVEQNIGKNVIKGLSNILHASANVPDNQAKNVTERILSLVDTLATALLSIKTSGQRQSVYDSDFIKMRLWRQRPKNLGNKTFSGHEEEGNVTFPSADVIFGSDEKIQKPGTVDTQIVTFKDNPYLWSDTSRLIRSSVLNLDLKMTNGSHLHISNLSEPIKLFIPIKESKETETAQDHYFVNSSVIRYHKVKLRSALETVFVKIIPDKDALLDIFVSAGVKPNSENYTFTRRIPDDSDNTSCRFIYPGTGFINCAINPYMFSFSSNSTGDHFIGIRLVYGRTKPVLKSFVKSHVRRKRWWITVKDPPATPISTRRVVPKYDSKTDVNYSMSVKIGTCLYWAENKQDWTSEGCKVGSDEGSDTLQCLCNHLSAFGGNLFVAPNPIDFEAVRKRFIDPEPDDFVVLVTVCIIFGIYFNGLVLARRADNNDKRKVVANVFVTTSLNMDGHNTKGKRERVYNPFQLHSTTDSSDKNVYHLSIETGMWMNSGTSANVALIINGEEGSSGEISLTDPLARRKLFSRGSVNNFILALPTSLGNLTDIIIWHDNKGSNPAWFLQEIVVTNQQTEEIWFFFANRWLSLDKRSGSIEVHLEPAKKDGRSLFKPLCYGRTARNLSEGHIWISLFTRPPQNPFTRCQRLSCCLSLLFTAMATNAAFYEFGDTQTDTFKFGPLVMSWKQIKIGIQSSLIAIPPNLLVTLMFKNVRSSGEFYDTVEGSKKTKTRGFLPPFFLYIVWLFCLAIALTGATVTVLYSLTWGADKSNPWLTSILVSTFQDILINEPVKLVVFAIVLSLLIKKPPEHETVVGPSFFQSPKVNNVKAMPAEDNEAEKEFYSKKWDMAQALKEFLSFVVLTIFLMFVCYGAQDPSRFQLTNSTISILGDFNEVDSKDSLWTWIENDLLPSLYNTTWYNGLPFEYKEGFISNKKAFILGMPRLRQLRLKKNEGCSADVLRIAIKDVYRSCHQTYSSDTEDTTSFHGPKWSRLENYSHFESIYHNIYQKPWIYQSASEINTLSHYAVEGKYDGGGFVADLGYNFTTASIVVRELKKHDWVDERTAAVFIEFTLFNPSTWLFCDVRNAFEVLPSGKAVTLANVRAISLYPSPNHRLQSFYEACQLFLLVVIVVFFICEMVKWIRQRKYFRHFWNWVELLVILISIAAIAVSFLKAKYTTECVKRIQKNPYESFSFDVIIKLLDLETLLLSLAMFLITLKFLRIIRFNPHIGQMYGTLETSARPILSFSVLFFVACVAFTQFLYLTFGPYLAPFSSFTNCLQVLFYQVIGKSVGNSEMHEMNPALAYFYMCFFFIVMSFILINVFVAILVLPYGEVRKKECGSKDSDAELGRLVYKTVLSKFIAFPARLLHVVKLSRKSTPPIFCQRKEYSGMFNSPDDVDVEKNTLIPPLATPEQSDIEDINDEEEYTFHENIKTSSPANPKQSGIEDSIEEKEYKFLEDIKVQFTEISSELRFLHNLIIEERSVNRTGNAKYM